MATDEFHIPALLKEAINGLNIKPDSQYIDATIGGGGHTREILRRGGRVLGIDQDPEAMEYVKENFQDSITSNQLKLAQGNFAHLKEIGDQAGFHQIAGIIFDLGVSSHQLETEERGFSFNTEAPLDMRMDPNLGVTAADLVNGLTEKELYELFIKYAEEFHSRAIARAIVRARTLKPIRTCNELAKIVLRVKRKDRFERTHPATRIFQALRMAVNDELNNLKKALPQAVELLDKDGRLAVLSFHSLEDRIVKNFFKEQRDKGILAILTQKPVRPGEEEAKSNPRARSAKLRIAEKL